MDNETRKLLRMFGVLSTAGMVIVFSTVIGVYAGMKIDDWLNTFPWFTAIFFLLGVFAGFRNLFRYAKGSEKMLEEYEKKKDKQ